jgi:hypothetical protein
MDAHIRSPIYSEYLFGSCYGQKTETHFKRIENNIQLDGVLPSYRMVNLTRVRKGIEQQHRDDKEEHAQDVGFLCRRKGRRRRTKYVGYELQKRDGEPDGENRECVEEGVEAQDEAKAYYLSNE